MLQDSSRGLLQKKLQQVPWVWRCLPLVFYLMDLPLFNSLYSHVFALCLFVGVVSFLPLIRYCVPPSRFLPSSLVGESGTPRRLKGILKWCTEWCVTLLVLFLVTFTLSTRGPLALGDYSYPSVRVLLLLAISGLCVIAWALSLCVAARPLPHAIAQHVFQKFPLRMQQWIGGYTDSVCVWVSWCAVAVFIITFCLSLQSVFGIEQGTTGIFLVLTGLLWHYRPKRCQRLLRQTQRLKHSWQAWFLKRVLGLAVLCMLVKLLPFVPSIFAKVLSNAVPEAILTVGFLWLPLGLFALMLPRSAQSLAQIAEFSQSQVLSYGISAIAVSLMVFWNFPWQFLLQALVTPLGNAFFSLSTAGILFGVLAFALRGVLRQGDILTNLRHSEGKFSRLWVRPLGPPLYVPSLFRNSFLLLGLYTVIGWWGLTCVLAPISLLILFFLVLAAFSAMLKSVSL